MSPPRAEVPPVRVPSDVRPRRALPCGPRRPFARSTSQLRAPRRAPARTVRPRAAVRVLWWGRAMRGPRGARCTRRSRVTPRRSPACRAIRLLRRSRRRRPRAGAQAPLRRMVLPLLRAGLLCTVHPRVHGERNRPCGTGSSPHGLSPRTRGTQSSVARKENAERSIPRAWGTRPVVVRAWPVRRFIPVCAGNTTAIWRRSARRAVYPRVGGARGFGFQGRIKFSVEVQ